MFQKIQQLIDDKDALVFVLIDEVKINAVEGVSAAASTVLLNIVHFKQVESLTAARNASQAGTEPSDAIRVVNSVLTQLDQIKRSGS